MINRKWEQDGDRLVSTDGVYEISMDETYGYFRLFSSEDTTTSLGEHLDRKALMLLADTLCIDEGCPHHGTTHVCVNS